MDCGFSAALLEGKRGTPTSRKKLCKNFKPREKYLVVMWVAILLDLSTVYGKNVGVQWISWKTVGFARAVVTQLKWYRSEELVAYHKGQQRRNKEQRKRLKLEKKARADQLAQWHIRELSDTAQVDRGKTIKVCMEKGPLFFCRVISVLKKVLRESESYARNDIKRVDGKQWPDQQAYAQASSKKG